jgi:acetyl esterase/lipase
VERCRQGGEEGGTTRGRLLAKPAPDPSHRAAGTGLRRLGLGSGRDGLLYVPPGHDATEETPLALTLHGAGGDARSGLSHLVGLADEFGLVLLAPESRGRTWDVLVGGFGPDVEFIDRALGQTFDRLNGGRRAPGDNGLLGRGLLRPLPRPNQRDLFTHAIAFSPGFAAPADRRGKPPVFVSHGTRDRVLPIERCSRRIVPQLEREGYEVSYREFNGPHTVPGRSRARPSSGSPEPSGEEDRLPDPVLGQTLTFRGSPCWWSSGSPLGEGRPCDSIIVDRYDDRRALCSGQGRWKIRAR